MSFQALSWASKQKVGNATGKAVLLMLANRCGNDDFSCYPAQKNIADECECGVRTVVSWLQKFEDMGLLTRERRHRQDGSRTSDMITLRVGSDLSAGNAHALNARAPDDKPTCTSCTPLNSQDNLSSSLRSEEPARKPKDILLDVVDETRANAIIQHRRSNKAALTDYSAKLLATTLSKCADPNAAADMMIERGWKSIKPDWFEREQAPPRGQSPPGNVRGKDYADLALDKYLDGERNGPGSFTQ